MRDGLPPEAWESARPATEWGQWSRTEMLLASVVDRLADLSWLTAAVNTSERDRTDPPSPMPRPGVGEHPRTTQMKRAISRAHALAIIECRGGEPTPEQIQKHLEEGTDG